MCVSTRGVAREDVQRTQQATTHHQPLRLHQPKLEMPNSSLHCHLSPQLGGTSPATSPRASASPRTLAMLREGRSASLKPFLSISRLSPGGTLLANRLGRLVARCRRWAKRRAGGKLLPRGVAQEEGEVGGAPCEPAAFPLPALAMCVCLVLQPCCTSVARARGEGRKSLFTQTANRLGNNAGKEVSRLSV